METRRAAFVIGILAGLLALTLWLGGPTDAPQREPNTSHVSN